MRLDEVADIAQVDRPAQLTRIDGERSATISATPSASDLGRVSADLQVALDGMDLTGGASYRLGGVSADQEDAFGQLGLALLAAIAIVFMVMVATFRSIVQPLILLVSVPFAATGALGMLLLTDTALGVPALIGLLMLIGIVVTNAIVLIDLINQYRRKGMPVRDAVIEGGRRRLRPILMTALATICALVPMSLGLTGGGVFISQPLALVVIGGLISSTLLTLVLVPTLYTIVEGIRERRALRREQRSSSAVRAPAPTGRPRQRGWLRRMVMARRLVWALPPVKMRGSGAGAVSGAVPGADAATDADAATSAGGSRWTGVGTGEVGRGLRSNRRVTAGSSPWDDPARSADPSVRSTDPSVRSADPSARSADSSAGSADPSARSADPSARSADPSARSADPARAGAPVPSWATGSLTDSPARNTPMDTPPDGTGGNGAHRTDADPTRSPEPADRAAPVATAHVMLHAPTPSGAGGEGAGADEGVTQLGVLQVEVLVRMSPEPDSDRGTASAPDA